MKKFVDVVGYSNPLAHFASGFWQSKNRYRSQQEFLDVAQGIQYHVLARCSTNDRAIEFIRDEINGICMTSCLAKFGEFCDDEYDRFIDS